MQPISSGLSVSLYPAIECGLRMQILMQISLEGVSDHTIETQCNISKELAIYII